MVAGVHVELFETGGAEGVAAVDHNSGNAIGCVVLFFAEGTTVLVEQFVDKFVDLFPVEVGRVFGLLEEEGGGVLQLFHI